MGAASLSGMGAEASAWGAALGSRAEPRPRPRACRPPGVPRGCAGTRRAEMESRTAWATPPCFKRTPQLRGPARRPDAGKLRGRRWGGGRPAAGRPERVSARGSRETRAAAPATGAPGRSGAGRPGVSGCVRTWVSPGLSPSKEKAAAGRALSRGQGPAVSVFQDRGLPRPAQVRGAGAWGPHARFSEPAR